MYVPLFMALLTHFYAQNFLTQDKLLSESLLDITNAYSQLFHLLGLKQIGETWVGGTFLFCQQPCITYMLNRKMADPAFRNIIN